MIGDEGRSVQIQGWIDRLRDGDPSARDHLLALASDRLARLTRKMIRDYPGVRRWEQTDDVLQNATLRLCRALVEVRPPTTRDFFRLAAAQIRRELIDLARRHSGPMGIGANHASVAGRGDHDGPPDHVADVSEATHDPARIALWTDFHGEVERLPDEEREVFDLIFYQGLSQAEAASLLDVSERTIKRRWQSARLTLHDALRGRMPGF